MKLKDIVEKMDAFTDDERQKYLGALHKTLCPMSHQTLQEFQDDWFSKDPASDKETFLMFVKEQNKIFRQCIDLEVSSTLGATVRKRFCLEPITMDTEIG